MMDLWAIVPYYTAYLSKSLLARGVDLQVGSISYYLDPECFSRRGLRLDPGLLNVVGRFRLPAPLRRVLKLAEALVNMAALAVRFLFAPPDVVHVQFLPMFRWKLPLDIWLVKFCRWRGSKIVLTVHDLLPHDSGNRYRQTFQAMYGFVDGIICHSDHVKKRLVEEFAVPAEKIWVIPHGPFFYDLPVSGLEQMLRGFGLEPGTKMVLWQGIIFPYKGIDLLLRAWQRVEAAGGAASLMIVGTGSPELLDQIRAQVAELGLTRVKMHFRFVSTEELVVLYRAADVVVYPYRAITTSGALATGLALGKAMVASDLAVFRELLTDGESALLVDPEKTADLAGAIEKLLADAELQERLQAKVRAMDFGDRTWLSIAEKTTAVYEAVLSR